MNRRTAMLLSLILGGLAPRALRAQSDGTTRKVANGRRASSRVALEPAKSRRADDDEAAARAPGDEVDTTPAAGIPAEPGQSWKNFDISGYTGLAHSQNSPQNAITEWIFRRTGSAPWHGDRIAVLCASRTQVRAYNTPKVLEQVAEVVDRFTDAANNVLSIRVRYVAAVDTRWRYSVYTRLTPVQSGPQGQQIWSLRTEDAAFVLAQMQIYRGFALLTDQKVEMINGQTLTVKTSEMRGYAGSLQRESAVGLGYQPKAEQLEEGVTLRLSPLLTYEGDALDAAIELTANTVKNLHRTRIIAPREVGPSEAILDVPEVTESRLNQTVKGWTLGQTLLISAGIQPGILQSKTGFLNLRIPGTVPTGTELLVFLDAEVVAPRGRAARD